MELLLLWIFCLAGLPFPRFWAMLDLLVFFWTLPVLSALHRRQSTEVLHYNCGSSYFSCELDA